MDSINLSKEFLELMCFTLNQYITEITNRTTKMASTLAPEL